jgi:O-antigen ligase
VTRPLMTARFPVVRPGPFLVLGLAGCLGLLAGVNPTLALVGACAIAFIAVLLASFPVATGIFIVVTFIDLPDNAAKGIGVLLAIGLLARIAAGRERGASLASAHPVVTAGLVMFLGWTMLGLLWAESGSAIATAVFRYALNFVLLFVIYSAVRTRRDFLLLAALFVLGSAIAAAYGLIYPPSPGLYDALSRSGGTLGDPNELAAVLVVGLLLSAALAAVRSVPGPIRVGAIVSGVLCMAGIALSLSRGGLLALGVALVLGVFVAGRWRVHMAALAVIVAIGTVGYFASYASPQALQHITTNNGGSGRSDIWTVAWRVFEANPVRGVGAGNFPVVSVHYLLSPGVITASRYIVDQPLVTHNTYLSLLAEQGVVGAALFIGILGFALRCYQLAWRASRQSEDRDLEILAYALFIGLVGFLAACFFISDEYSKQLWILLALAPALRRLAVGARRDEDGVLTPAPLTLKHSPVAHA